MLWLAGEILVLLVVAAVVGAGIGWTGRAISTRIARGGRMASRDVALGSNGLSSADPEPSDPSLMFTDEGVGVQLADLQAALDDRDGQIESLRAELEQAAPDGTEKLRAELEELRGWMLEAADQLAARDERIAMLEEELNASRAWDETEAGLTRPTRELPPLQEPDEMEETERAVIGREPEALVLSDDGWGGLVTEDTASEADFDVLERETADQDGVERDDLKVLRGIGPRLESRLNELGIVSLRQIAEFTDADIETVGDALGSFADRIVRDGWVEQARAKHRAKYGVDIGSDPAGATVADELDDDQVDLDLDAGARVAADAGTDAETDTGVDEAAGADAAVDTTGDEDAGEAGEVEIDEPIEPAVAEGDSEVQGEDEATEHAVGEGPLDPAEAEGTDGDQPGGLPDALHDRTVDQMIDRAVDGRLSQRAAEAPAGALSYIADRTADGEELAEDDLKRIRGIGRVLELRLKDGGIVSFRQIARLSDDDIPVVAEALKIVPSRITDFGWVEAAARLAGIDDKVKLE